jgi:protein-arginine kinase
MVSTRKQLFSSVHRAFVIESTVSIAVLVPGMLKENSEMSCVFCNEIHSLLTNLNISDHLSKVVSDFVFQLSSLLLLIFAV